HKRQSRHRNPAHRNGQCDVFRRAPVAARLSESPQLPQGATMKTRIIQNEPEEPANGAQTIDATVGEPKHLRNLAARMGRWSASHKKTATFGWLAFIAAAFMFGHAVGTKQLDPNKAGTGESGHVDS